ncbi:putative ABC transporter, substrate-binding protein [Desulfonema limicola]|uniref:ABC transporter, substrate-binding protein n=1 Tax=Desulfonema limicola TaxID=45656 RepID=A0A975BCA0_9BACT|nr:adenosylcobinamide amidohydrolase [Desulfonema limicola]QTA82615.1 putative ABC transporter, substrate-binding protein [Desulfonema limicola]
MKLINISKSKIIFLCLIYFFFGKISPGFSFPVNFQDADGRNIQIDTTPERVVSIVPSVTEIIFSINAGNRISGLTYHDTYPAEASFKKVVGGFFSPSIEKIEQINPDIIFITDLHQKLIKAFENQNCRLIHLKLNSVSDLNETIMLLGQIFDKKDEAEKLINNIKTELEHTALKIKPVPISEKKRVIRLMGREDIMTPGSDSFQNEFISLAGGIAPELNKKGQIITITKQEWIKFNPQIIYGCGEDKILKEKILTQPGWKDVDAVKNKKIFFFPCDLTCRLSSRTGYFISCLASKIYPDAFASNSFKDQITGSKLAVLDLDYVKSSEIINSSVYDFIHKTLLIQFKTPVSVLSSLEGFRENIRYAGNSYSPYQVWELYHNLGLDLSRQKLLESIGKQEADTSLLFTGADMDNLSVQHKSFKDMNVYALVTAGVKSNAMRMGRDTGLFYEPGTINMLILTSMELSDRAMTRAVITATEAKTSALQDMDIRSSYTPFVNPATGTGTDNIIVVKGAGTRIDNAGGHSKMGELIAKAVYDGVSEAVYKQNSIIQNRSIFHRLKDRHISLYGLISNCSCTENSGEFILEIEKILLNPGYAGFIESAFAVSDAYERKLVSDLSAFNMWCNAAASEISGQKITNLKDLISDEELPIVIKTALNALLTGIYYKINSHEQKN